MIRDVSRHQAFIWTTLVSVSLLTLFLAEGGHAWSGRAVSTGLLLLGFFKARLIILYFMEFANGPLWLRFAGEAWVAVSCSVVLGFYWLG